jgi:pyruvate formate lyase activating enzyme
MTEEALELILPYLDVYRVDIKAFSSAVYRKIAHVSDFSGILAVTEKAKRYGMHVEVVTNVIPGFNDDDGQLEAIATWVRTCVGDETPWHVTRFHPHLELSNLTPTKISVLERAREIGISCGLKFVYLGNVPGHAGENTYCPNCGALLIRRHAFDVIENIIKDGDCPHCDTKIAGRF